MTAPLAFLDTNILLRHLVGEPPDQARKASALMLRIEQGEVRVRLTDAVVFETVLTLQRYYNRQPAELRDALLPLLELPGVLLPGKRRLRPAFTLYVDSHLPFADAYHAALLHDLRITTVYSFDPHFDRIAGLTRIEP
jgi:predicted nucleic acid-binding protein